MRELALTSPVIYGLLAQAAGDFTGWERLGFLGTSLFVTAFLWKFFTDREKQREDDFREVLKSQREKDAAERNRFLADMNELQTRNNEMQAEMIEIMKARALRAAPVIVENASSDPIPTVSQRHHKP